MQPATGDMILAKPASARKTSAKAAPSGENFALRSLQKAHADNKRFAASDAQLLHFYEQMLLIRRFEERAGQLYGLGLIGGFCHLYIGQEAVAVGFMSSVSTPSTKVIWLPCNI